MSKMIVCFFIVSRMLFINFNMLAKMPYQETTAKFFINYVEVTEEQFYKKLKTLKETGGWFCTDSSTGGTTGYDCKDSEGKVYKYECDTDLEDMRCSLTQKDKELKKYIIPIIDSTRNK